MAVENPGQRTQSPGKDPACTGEPRATQKSVNSIRKNGERSRALEPGRLPGSAAGVLDLFPNLVLSHSLEVENGNDTHHPTDYFVGSLPSLGRGTCEALRAVSATWLVFIDVIITIGYTVK